MNKHKSSPMEIINGEMLIFGQQLPRHPEFPWLFSATHLHKFCEQAIRRKAESVGKDPDKFYEAKRPAQWIRFNILNRESKERVEHYAEHTRRRIKKYGPNLGFANRKNSTTVRNLTVENMEDLEVVCVTVNGGPMRGSYLCQLAIVKYVETFSDKFRAIVQDTFVSVANGEVEEVTAKVEENYQKAKGTPTRKENAELMKDLDRACWTKNLGTHAQVLNGIHHGVLGKSGANYLKDTNQSQPLNDRLSVKTLATKNIAVIMSTVAIQEDARPELTGAEGKAIGYRSGSYAKFISENEEVKAMFEAHFKKERCRASNR